MTGCSHILKAKTEWVSITRPDLPLQPRPAGQIGAGRATCGRANDISTLLTGGHFNITAT